MLDFKPDFNRLKKVLLREGEPDRVPFYELFADREIIQAVTKKEISLESLIEFQMKLGYDYIPVGVPMNYPMRYKLVEDTAALPREQRAFVDDNKGTIENRQDFDSYPWPIADETILTHFEAAAPILPEGMKIIVLLSGILENVVWLMGYIPFSYAIYEDEQLIWDMFERIGSNHLNFVSLCLEKGPLASLGAVVMGDDMGYNHSTMISPELMRKYVFPWQKKLVDLIHHYELPMILHSCGKLDGIMDDLIDYVGIDAKHSFEDKILPVTEAKKRFGNRIAILGGIDMNFLCTTNESQVRAYVRQVLSSCMPGGGYALGTGNSVANYIPLRNYLAMLDEGRLHGQYQD